MNEVENKQTEPQQSEISEQDFRNDVRIIRKWVQFFGYITIAGIVIAGLVLHKMYGV